MCDVWRVLLGDGEGEREKAMRVIPISLAVANAFVETLHRHHGRMQGHRFSIGVIDEGLLVGVAIVGRPVGGANNAHWCEVSRCCTDGTRNACSALYGAAARAAKALGYERIQTYILEDELGTSLRASGWQYERLSHPVGWHHDGPRPARKTKPSLMGRKQLWFKHLSDPIPEYEVREMVGEDQLSLIDRQAATDVGGRHGG